MQRCVRCANEMSALTVFCPRCQHPNEPDFKQLLHQTLGHRFQLYRPLGEGGLSTVFAAIDLQTDKTVVVKVSDPRHLTQTTFTTDAERLEARQYWAEMTERMQREVAALTNIQHPNIVKVLAAGTISADLSYVVMELLRGKTLREELNVRHRLPVSEAVALVIEVAAALSVIHARGIVHRDLTPRNIFLCEEILDFRLPILDSPQLSVRPDESTKSTQQSKIQNPKSKIVKLIDFGIAKFPKPPGAQTYTQHAVMAGTPGYASPEQFQNLPVDQRADIYSLGVMLYEMVTGEKPFSGRSATEIALKQIRDECVRPRALVPDLPIRLEALILRALAKDPAVRQQSADELMAELKTISARIEVPFAAPPQPAIEAEPSGTEIFTLLSDLVAKAEAKPVPTPATVEPIPVSAAAEAPPEMKLEMPPPRRHRVLVIAAVIALLFILATWLVARQNPGGLPLTQSTLSPTPFSTAAPTPTLRPDVTAPRNARSTSAPEPSPEVQPARASITASLPTATPATMTASLPKAVPTTKASPPLSKLPSPTARPTATPMPEIAARVPQPTPTPRPPISIEPTPSPAPPPVQPRANPSTADNGGWRREPPRSWPERTEPTPTPTPARRIEPVPEMKVITWQGRVNGSREITLEMPGVPGMVDVPRNLRKKIGVVEPPSPSNGWRRAVLRVFGDGEVSLLVRWWPHREARVIRQEIVGWTLTK